jgi:hypothetical protein
MRVSTIARHSRRVAIEVARLAATVARVARGQCAAVTAATVVRRVREEAIVRHARSTAVRVHRVKAASAAVHRVTVRHAMVARVRAAHAMARVAVRVGHAADLVAEVAEVAVGVRLVPWRSAERSAIVLPRSVRRDAANGRSVRDA